MIPVPEKQPVHHQPGPVPARQAEPPATAGQRFVRPAAQDGVGKLIKPDKDGLAIAHIVRHGLQPPPLQQAGDGLHTVRGLNKRLARAALRHLRGFVRQGRRV